MTMTRFLTRLLRRRPVVVTTYKVKAVNYRRAVNAKCAQLARELGKPWPKEGRG